MLPDFRKNFLDRAANFLTIIVAVIFFSLLIHRYLLAEQPKVVPSPKVGDEVSIAGFTPAAERTNVLLVLMKGCRFCEASAPFYKDRLARTDNQRHRIVAIFPDEAKEAPAYISKLGLAGLDVFYSSLRDINVSGTPTIIVTDGSGLIVASWVGQLSKEQEQEVIDLLAL